MKLSYLDLAVSGPQIRTALKTQAYFAAAKLPSHMRAWQCLRFLQPETHDVSNELHCTHTRRLPTLSRPDHVLVKVDIASLNPIDLMNLYGYGSTSFYYARKFFSTFNLLGFSDQAGTLTGDDSMFPWTPGRDFTGTVVSCGPQAVYEGRGFRSRVTPGQRIIGVTWPFLSSVGSGALAQYVLCPASYTALLPNNVQPEQAAAIGYSGLTAWSALVTGGLNPQLRSRTRFDIAASPLVLVTGATGGVGSIAVQLAKLSGARVHVTCRSDRKALEMMKQLEVEDIIVYPDQPAANTRYDIIIDCIRRRDLNALSLSENPIHLAQNAFQDVAPLFAYLKPLSTSRYVSLNSPFLHLIDRLGLLLGGGATLFHMAIAPWTLAGAVWPIRFPDQLRWAFFQPSGHRLAQMLRWAADGQIKVFIDDCFPFEEVLDAFARFQSTPIRGKILIQVSSEP